MLPSRPPMVEAFPMGDTWVTDMRHFEDVADMDKAARIPGPAVRLGRYLGRIVEAVTARWSDRDVPLATVGYNE